MADRIGIDVINATVANGTALSAEVDLGAKALVGIAMPAAWTAAAMTFQVSADGGATWLELTTTAGAAVNYTVANGQFIAVDPAQWKGINAVKVRSGTSGVPVNQGADRTIGLVVRPVS